MEKSQRTFYVDASLSIVNKEGKKYWKCSVVENGENVANFYNSVVDMTTISKKNGKTYQTGTNHAEAFTILKLMFWLEEQKYQGAVKVFTDNELCVKTGNKKTKSKKSKKKFKQYLTLAYEIAERNKIDLVVSWIKGSENPADYYSRMGNRKGNYRNNFL